MCRFGVLSYTQQDYSPRIDRTSSNFEHGTLDGAMLIVDITQSSRVSSKSTITCPRN